MKHKDHYDDGYVRDFAWKLSEAAPYFDREKFVSELTGKLDDKELFGRFDLIAGAMENALGDDFPRNVEAFTAILGEELSGAEGMFNFGWWLWPVSRYMERHGNENWRLSLGFLKELTKRFTGEYAIRPLLAAHPGEVMDELIIWTGEDNVHVRRLASEGVRIRLPWSQKLYAAIDEPDRYRQILTNLRHDGEKFVQKSVGNNLNDLFKEVPEMAEDIIAGWEMAGTSKAQEWIIRHGRRNQT